ncbi:MAG: stage III sporulation protein AF [Oscillospiraceae bacterium]|jgi:hypothetical protein|nr:stage III sporulation protein AF [Oscillospiraceae bacterium]
MDFLRQWILGIAGAAVVGTVALAVTPSGSVKKAVRLASALLLIGAVLRPLTGWKTLDFEDFFIETVAAEGVEKPGQELLSGLIADRTSAYIVNKAQAVGLAIEVSVVIRENAPWSAEIVCGRPEHAKSALSQTLTGDLGIPPERQRYTEG